MCGFMGKQKIENMDIDYNSIVEKVCIPLIIAILALGLPVLLQTATRIDDKYNSTRLLRAFYKERITRFFIAINIFSLISIIIWFLNLPRIHDFGKIMNYIIDKSAFLLIFFSTVLLIFSLFKFISLIKIYFDPLRLFSYKERKHAK